VFATYITHISDAEKFLFLVAIVDLLSRYVLTCKLSNSPDT
jgi:hypothetical protein